ncbi:9448_t:CDS:2 [Rhizophagus irregularis]|nr:9448_t:CDS:2 [Rhizophagus irregularis]
MSTLLKNVTIKSHEMTRPKPPVIVGTGSLGKIYKVQYKGADAIIKSAKEDLDAILEEFHIHYKLREHENVLKFYGIIKKDDRIALIYEYATHGKLTTFLKNNSLGWDIKSKLCHDITLALFHCHELDISDYTIKLDDIYLTDDRTVKIAAISSDQEMKLSLINHPKLANIYSLGLIFWAIVMNGKIPYEGMTRDKIIEEKRQHNANELLQNLLPQSIPSKFSNIIFKMTKYAPRQRPCLLEVLCVLEELYDFSNQKESLLKENSKQVHTEINLFENLSSDSRSISQASQFYASVPVHKKFQSTDSMDSLMNSYDNNKNINSKNSNHEYRLSKIDVDLLGQITMLYLDSEKFGFDWFTKSLKHLTETEKRDSKKCFELINLDLSRPHRQCILGFFYEEGFAAIETLKARKRNIGLFFKKVLFSKKFSNNKISRPLSQNVDDDVY